MSRRAFRIGGWIALVLGGIAAIAAAAVVVTGVLAMAGRATYPVNAGVGPFTFHQEVSMPVVLAKRVCGSVDIGTTERPDSCLRLFVHPVDWDGGGSRVRTQDADIRPTVVRLDGTVELATTGGWSRFAAVSVTRAALGLAIVSAVLLLLSRLLARAAAGTVFSGPAVTYARGIGWLLIAGSLVGSFLGAFSNPTKLGYGVEAFGSASASFVGLHGEGVDLEGVALGGLVLLLAEVFRRGAAVEDEQRLTV